MHSLNNDYQINGSIKLYGDNYDISKIKRKTKKKFKQLEFSKILITHRVINQKLKGPPIDNLKGSAILHLLFYVA